MRIFLSYASEDENLANQIRLKLQAVGYDVFFSAANIQASEGYDERIRQEMAGSDRLLFIASPASLAQGCYTQTELALAEHRWPNPKGKVMAVMVGVGAGDLPPFLGAVSSAVAPKGDAASHVTATVLDRWPKRFRRFIKPALWTLVIGGVLALGAMWYLDKRERDEQAQVLPRLTIEEFQVALQGFRELEEASLQEQSKGMLSSLFWLVGKKQFVPRPTDAPPTEIPAQPAARLERLALWAYPQGETKAEQVAARRAVVSDKVIRELVKLLAAEKYTVTADVGWLQEHRAPGSDEPLLIWYIRAWTRPLDPSDPADLRAGNRMLTGTANDDPPDAWPPEATARTLTQTRLLLDGLARDDQFAQSLVFVSAVAGRLEHMGWDAPDHPIRQAYDHAMTLGQKDIVPLWRIVRPDADQYVINQYRREYVAP